MKIFLTIFLVFIISNNITKAQTYNSSCIATSTQQTIYHNDACKLALKRLQEIGSTFSDSVTIPEIFIDSLERSLFAIDNMQNALVADTLREIFGYTNFYPGADSSHFMTGNGTLFDSFPIKEISITVNNNSAWGSQWLMGNYNVTNNDSVNYLMNIYGLSVRLDIYQFYHDSTKYIVSSPVAINAAALARKFGDLSGVCCAGAIFSSAAPGNSIEAVFTQGYIQLNYSFGCGDCVMGCTIRRNWSFQISTQTDCTVNYLSVTNTGLPIMWLTSPCIDNLISVTLCPGDSSLFTLNSYRLSDTLQWVVSTDNGITYNSISDNNYYTGTNTANLHLYNIPSAWYGYRYTCLANGNSKKLYYGIKIQNNWNTNAADNSWENTANWSCGSLPDSNTDVVITSGNVVVNSDVTVRSLSVSAGATVTVSPGNHLTLLH